MGSLAGFVGTILGALAITFLVTRVAIKATGPTRRGAIAAFVIGLAISWMVPITVGAILYSRGPEWANLFTYTLALLVWLSRDYKRATDNIVDKPMLVDVEPHIDSFVAQGSTQHTNAALSKEIIAFRFLLLTWGVSLLILCFAGYYYYEAVNTEKYYLDMAKMWVDCQDRFFKWNPTCNNETCMKDMKEMCSTFEEYTDKRSAEVGLWSDQSDNALCIAVTVFFLSSFLFYGIRWAITGRLKPLWLFK